MTRTDTRPNRGLVTSLKAARRRVRSTRAGRITWQIIVGALGLTVIGIGVVLLPLPGPGWLIIFAGLGILATEFEWASRLLRFARATLARWTGWVAGQGRVMQALIGVAGLVVLAAALAGAWWLYFR